MIATSGTSAKMNTMILARLSFRACVKTSCWLTKWANLNILNTRSKRKARITANEWEPLMKRAKKVGKMDSKSIIRRS